MIVQALTNRIPTTQNERQDSQLLTMTPFLRPSCAQAASRLTQLPRELLLTILRCLLHFPGNLYKARSLNRDEVKYYKAKVKAGCRLMQTCQTIYLECRHVLFEENVLKLRLRGPRRHRLEFLNQSLSIDIIPGRQNAPPNIQEQTLYESSRITKPHIMQNLPRVPSRLLSNFRGYQLT